MSRSLGCPARAGQRVKGRGQGSESKQQRKQGRAEHEVTYQGFDERAAGPWPLPGQPDTGPRDAMGHEAGLSVEWACGHVDEAPRREGRPGHRGTGGCTYQAVP